jgi:hypothetical protein
MQNKLLVFIIFCLLIGLCAWSPWLTETTASQIAEAQFSHAWQGVMDGCGLSGSQYGAQGFYKVPFGAVVILSYQCGLVMPNEPPLQTNVYVSFLGIAFGYPAP